MLSSELIVEKFEHLSFCDGLKQSKQQLFSTLHIELKECIDKTRECLEKIHEMLLKPNLTSALIDHSIVSRTEFESGCTSNRALAKVGSARLDVQIATDLFCKGENSTISTNKKSSALAFFEKYMDTECVFYYKFGGNLSKEQMINFVYALVGVYAIEAYHKEAEFLCNTILTNHE